jgi:hypothetical protein
MAELLVAEDGQAFLEAELEPVAAGDAVARPVVEVLVPDHAFDVGEVGVGGRGWLASTYLVLKMFRPLFSIAPMLKSLVATIMKRSRSSAQAKARLVPGHAGHERVHGVLGLVQVAGAHIHLQQMLLARA